MSATMFCFFSPVVNACHSYPCENGGSCIENGNSNYTCQCPEGYEGTHCEIEKIIPTPPGGKARLNIKKQL